VEGEKRGGKYETTKNFDEIKKKGNGETKKGKIIKIATL